MRLKLILGTFLSLLVGPWKPAFAVCDPTLQPTYTTRAGIQKPAINSCGWGAATNNNWNIVDSSVALLSSTNTFTSTNQFSSIVLRNPSNINPLLRFNDATGTKAIDIQPPTPVSAGYQLNLPNQQGAANTVLMNDGSGNLSFSNASGNFIQNTSSLQSGATFYVSSGTVTTQFNVGTVGSQWTQYSPLSISPSTFAGSVIPLGSLSFTNTSVNGSPVGFRFNTPNGAWVAGIDTLNAVPLSLIRTNLTISSATTVNSTLTVSSNTILPGATFYQNAPTVINSVNAISALQFNGTSFLKIMQIQNFTSSSSSATTVSASFVPSNSTGTITPSSVSSKILVIACNTMQQATQNQGVFADIQRSGTNLSGSGSGFANAQSAGIGAVIAPFCIVFIDSPASTSNVGYGVVFRTGAGGTATIGTVGMQELYLIELL